MNLKKVVISIVMLMLATYVTVKVNNSYPIFVVPEFDDIKNNVEIVITVSTILMGFAFTVMGLLYTFDATAFVKKMKSTDYVIKRANNILFCLWILGFSSVSGVFLIMFNIEKIYAYVYVFSLLSLLLGIVLFIISTNSVYRLIANVHQYDQDKVGKKYAAYAAKRKKGKIQKDDILDEEDDTW